MFEKGAVQLFFVFIFFWKDVFVYDPVLLE